jgi:CHAD domain-containing protein
MGYRLTAGKPVADEICRLAGLQLELAARKLRAASVTWNDGTVHAARRHIKKTRALARLARKALGSQYQPTNERLRGISRMLAPLTDSEAVLGTLVRMRRVHGDTFPRHTYLAVRSTLLRRKRRLVHRTRFGRILQQAARQLREEAAIVREWELDTTGLRAVAPGVERTYRRARTATARAIGHPILDNFHTWRRRVKDLWLQMRVLEDRCANQLAATEAQLARLDEYLGEYHNVEVLQHVVMTEALDSRKEAAHFLRLLRRYQRALRQEAIALSTQIFEDTPRQFTNRVRRLWRAAQYGQVPRRETRPWPHAA